MQPIKSGTIISSRNDGGGEVLLDSGERIVFSTGSFDSGWPVRPPRHGDPVVVRLSDATGKMVLVYVRLRKGS